MTFVFEDSIVSKELCSYVNLRKLSISLFFCTFHLTHVSSHSHHISLSFQHFYTDNQISQDLLLIMKITQVYAIVMTEFFLAFVIKSFLHVLIIYSIKIRMFLLRHFFYFNLIHRHNLLNSLERIHAFAQLIYVVINVFFVSFQASFISKADTRVEILFLINMLSIFADSHLNFFSNLTEVILKIHRRLHRSTNIMFFALMLFHVLILVSDRMSFSSDDFAKLYFIIVNILFKSAFQC
jgi:hypothetical protein